MSYQKLPLPPYALGDSEWGWDQYQNAAVAAANQKIGDFFIVSVGRNGAFVRAQVFPTAAAASDAWDVTPSLPSDVGFAILYDKTRPSAVNRVLEQRVNPLIETVVKSQIDWQSLAPWAIAGTVVIAGAIYFTSGKGKRSRSRRR